MILPLFFGASLFFLICTAGQPFRISPSAGISAARFAPRSQQSLAPPFQGAKSSQKFRAAAYLRPTFPRRDLLPAPRKALRHRPGEQNLHRNSAPPHAFDRHFRGAICSPLPAKPCCFVPGSKIFTEVLRRHLPPAAFSAARFAPRPPQSLAPSFRGAKSSQKFRAAICLRRSFQRRDLLPVPRKAFRLRSGEQNLHRDSAPPSASGDSCWRCPAGKALCLRRAAPTGRPKTRLPADHVGAVPPAKPHIAVGPRQQGAQAMREEKKTADTYPS